MTEDQTQDRDEVAPQDELGGRRTDEEDVEERTTDGSPADGEGASSASGGDGEAAGTVEEREAVATDDDDLFG